MARVGGIWSTDRVAIPVSNNNTCSARWVLRIFIIIVITIITAIITIITIIINYTNNNNSNNNNKIITTIIITAITAIIITITITKMTVKIESIIIATVPPTTKASPTPAQRSGCHILHPPVMYPVRCAQPYVRLLEVLVGKHFDEHCPCPHE